MPRIRTIKPEFFTSEDIVSLPPFTRLLYISLWCEADREGCLAWKPKTFKMRYFPVDNFDVDKACYELVEKNLVVLYGDNLAFIPSFLDHQHINPRESASKLPKPDASLTRHSRDSDVQVGRERKGKSKHASVDARFDSFWKAYPNKVAKAAAEKAWVKLNGSVDIDLMLTALEVQKRVWRDPKFIPHASTWLNGRRWEDNVTASDDPFASAL